jgi:Arc/MetJ-type ribon-helix-helix transcriptional regulator
VAQQEEADRFGSAIVLVVRGAFSGTSRRVGTGITAMTKLDHIMLSEEAASFVQALVASRRFRSVDDALAAAVEALKQRDGIDADRAALLRAAWDEGMESMAAWPSARV